MIDPEALCWICKKPGCDAEASMVAYNNQRDAGSSWTTVRKEYHHQACLEEWHKKLIPLLDDRPSVSESREGFESYLKRRDQLLEEFQKNRGKE